jgi:hypothetical protein
VVFSLGNHHTSYVMSVAFLLALSASVDAKSSFRATPTPAIPTEFQGEWCSVPDSEFGEHTRGRCQGEYSTGWFTVFSDHMDGHEWGCTLKRRIEFGTLWGGEFECGAEATLSVTTYMLHIDGVTGRLVMHAVGWQWSWTEESEDENREATVDLSEGHNFAIEKCQYENITFSFPRNFAELPKLTQRKWDNQHRVWIKWRGGEPIQFVATESEKYGAHTFTFDFNRATVLTMASRDISMFVCASASGDCTEVSTLNMVRAIEFVCATKAAGQANSEAKPKESEDTLRANIRHAVCVGSVEHYGHGSDTAMWVLELKPVEPIVADCMFFTDDQAGKIVMRICGPIVDKDSKFACRIEGLFEVAHGGIRMSLIRADSVRLVRTGGRSQ